MPESLAVNMDELLLAAARSGAATTGRKLVTFQPGAEGAAMAAFTSRAGMRVAQSGEFNGHALEFAALGDANAVVFSEIGVAVLSAPEDQMAFALEAESMSSGDATIEDEYFVFTSGMDIHSYLKGFRSAADRITGDLLEGVGEVREEVSAEALGATWGLTSTKAVNSNFSGAGIRVAILDTGIDLGHPDFAGRSISSQSFIAGQAVQDLHGHGTHCCGTSCGTKTPPGSTQRYGIAHQAMIFAGKVLSNAGSGADGGILAGINWAIANNCSVISMSLGAQGPVSAAYEQAAKRGLAAGTLIVAASGNDSTRPGVIKPTGRPANSPSIVAVAALSEQLRVAPFSNGGKIEIAGPGVNVFSSFPMPQRYNTLSGTSMATPHVAGCAALLAQSNPSLRGAALRQALLARARRLPLPATDVGAGLVQAP